MTLITLLALTASLASAADLPIPPPQQQIERRFGVWDNNPIAFWNLQNKSSSSPRSSESLTRKSGKKTK